MVNWLGKRDTGHPLAPLREVVIFPNTVVGLSFGRDLSKKAVKAAGEEGSLVLATQKDPYIDNPKTDDIYQVGTLGIVRQIRESGEGIDIIFEGRARVFIQNWHNEGDYYRVDAQKFNDTTRMTKEIRARQETIINQFKQLISSGKTIPLETVIRILAIDNPHELINAIVSQLDLPTNYMQEALEIRDAKERLNKAIELLAREITMREGEQQGQRNVFDSINRMQRDAAIREEIKMAQREVGEARENEYEELRRQISTSGMPEEIRQKADKELKRLEQMSSLSPEISYIRTYLDWLVSLPWSKQPSEKIELSRAKEVLEAEHYALSQVKDRILEYIAVQQLTGKARGSILCFMGPPGTGKTSVGRSIAHALGRKFTKVSLGGIKDEAEIRGHRRTYVGAMPGRIIQGIANAGSYNPVFMLDEIDKVGMDFRGDPSAALLEALDPEQNHSFSDHYLEVPFDLSDTIFITTANVLDTIPPALRDRMEVIEFAGYSSEEKLEIARRHLLKKIREAHGLSENQWQITPGALQIIIEGYTREAGVRNLERELSKIARKVARKIVETKLEGEVIDEKKVVEYLGSIKITPWVQNVADEVGISTALAWTEAGGEILSIEAEILPKGRGDLSLTGNMGNVMKESAQTALAYARAYAESKGKSEAMDKNHDVHIHIPAGAIPKDGPSAGLAIAIAIISFIMQRPVNNNIALTGEITLRGKLLRIGGVKEKILAAQRAGLSEVVLPEENRADCEELQEEIRRSVKLTFARYADEAIERILLKV